MRKCMPAIVVSVIALLLTGVSVVGCTQKSQETESIMVYCGAGMRKPMDEIREVFSTEIRYRG